MDLDNEELKATRKRKTIFDILHEEEKIEKFLDLILNKHYCDDCNNLCSISETFPLKFIANYIISQRKRIKSKERVIESKNEYIKNLEEYIKELGGEV